jgi:enamine deaminase RidA (YjgF/YER057c/UK114 family)
MTTPSQRLADLGIDLPPVAAPAGAYVPFVRSGNLVFLAGQIPFVAGTLEITGIVGDAVSLEQAQGQARIAALNALAALAQAAGGLDRVARIVRVGVFVAANPAFTQHPAVANGASQLLFDVFGEAGRHARAAVGVASLPLGACVEVELTAELIAGA